MSRVIPITRLAANPVPLLTVAAAPSRISPIAKLTRPAPTASPHIFFSSTVAGRSSSGPGRQGYTLPEGHGEGGHSEEHPSR